MGEYPTPLGDVDVKRNVNENAESGIVLWAAQQFPPPAALGTDNIADAGPYAETFRNASDDLAEHVLIALSLLGGAGTPTDVTWTIRSELGRPASEARIYGVSGTLVEEGQIFVSRELCYDGRRNRNKTVLRLRKPPSEQIEPIAAD